VRNALPIGIGVLVGAMATGAVFVAIDRGDRTIVDEPIVKAAPVAPVPVVKGDAGPKTSRATPTTPDYGPRAAAPQVIYRCRAKAGTSYSNEPCPGGSIVDGASAVIGYDSRPSERLSRLVAEGRATADEPQVPVYRTRVPSSPETHDCAQMRRQIRDIDAMALRPQDLRSLDELRSTRQDIRTSMARLHC
jgi:hypothetical protein